MSGVAEGVSSSVSAATRDRREAPTGSRHASLPTNAGDTRHARDEAHLRRRKGRGAAGVDDGGALVAEIPDTYPRLGQPTASCAKKSFTWPIVVLMVAMNPGFSGMPNGTGGSTNEYCTTLQQSFGSNDTPGSVNPTPIPPGSVGSAGCGMSMHCHLRHRDGRRR